MILVVVGVPGRGRPAASSAASLVGAVRHLPRATPCHLMYAWDGLVVGFLFFWCIGLITELQRSEVAVAVDKFLHLPVSLNGRVPDQLPQLARCSLSLIVFVPVMLGFALALVFARGRRCCRSLPLLAAFLLMVTALTYQFQGWLASLMGNPRRRRTRDRRSSTLVFVLISSCRT